MPDGLLLQRLGIQDQSAWRRIWQQRLQSITAVSQLDPLLLWDLALPLLSVLEATLVHGPQTRPVIGLQAPVGAGKSTLARQLQQLARSFGCDLAVASIDDAYLGWSERDQRLAGNPFGVNRVPPGSHDPQLLLEAIHGWRQDGLLRLPRFDKTLRNGQGDRSGWSHLEPQALLLEGWLVGYEPVADETLQAWVGLADHDLSPLEIEWLPRWNHALGAYGPLWRACNGFWVLEPQDWTRVLRWRLQAEARQRRRGGGALAPGALRSLVRASLASLPPGLYQPQLRQRAMAIAELDGLRRCLRVLPGLHSAESGLDLVVLDGVDKSLGPAAQHGFAD